MDDLIKAAKENNMDIIAFQEIWGEEVGKGDKLSQEFPLFWSYKFGNCAMAWFQNSVKIFKLFLLPSNRCLFKCARSWRHELLVFSCYQKNLERFDVEKIFALSSPAWHRTLQMKLKIKTIFTSHYSQNTLI
jgi:hypothetical protein